MRLWSPLTHSALTHIVTVTLFEGGLQTANRKVRVTIQECVTKWRGVDIFECGENTVKQETELKDITYTPAYCRCKFYMLKEKVWVINTSAKATFCPEL